MRETLTLYQIAEDRDIDVDFVPLRHAQALSMPLGKRYTIVLDPRKVQSAADERVKLSHELGHCLTGGFYSREAGAPYRRRCERRAQRWAVNTLVPYGELQRCLRQGMTAVWELADHFEVTEPFMRQALAQYHLLDE